MSHQYIKSEIAATVIEINISKGDIVSAGDELVVLTSMKMELSIAAERTGKVEKIHVAEGDTVHDGDILVTLSE